MEVWTQTSTCGCDSRKNSTISIANKHYNGHQHHQHQHNNRRSSSLRPLQPVEMNDGEEAGKQSLSLTALHIHAIKMPTSGADDESSVVASEAVSLTLPVQNGAHHDVADENEGDEANGARNRAHGSRQLDKSFGLNSPRSGGATPPRNGGHVYVSQPFSPRSLPVQPTRQPLRDVSLRPGVEALSRSNTDLVITHGHFVARRPPPGSRSKSDVTRRAATKERCRSGAFSSQDQSSSGVFGGGGGGSSAVRARRGNSAGEGRYSGRLCDACSLHQFRDWVKEKQLERHEQRPERMYILDNGRWLKLGENGQPEMAMTTVSPAGKGLPKLTGLKHEIIDPNYYEKHRAVAEMQAYERMVHRPLPKTDPRTIPIVRKRVAVIKNRAMMEHLKQGRKLLKEKQAIDQPDQCVDLFTDILHYNVPGVSRMQKDYTVLLESKVPTQQESTQDVSVGYYNLARSTNNNADQHKVETTTPILQRQQDQGFSLPSLPHC